ncbi:hypothetical protein D0Z67_29340 (plasmid) [Streptomyces seoulensis]|uniref:Uncharacterized protein n=1 Tax=Streptomyces seoulensis TaxID=73044 RepID=A0A4P6U2X6_STRSO|nr:hypothetical protein D0Z67_29340 [Streptomyces seoulensis]
MRIPPLLAQSVLVGVIAVGTAWGWLTLIGARVLSPGAVIVCTIVAVALAMAVEAGWRAVRYHRRRRAHARTVKTRKAL